LLFALLWKKTTYIDHFFFFFFLAGSLTRLRLVRKVRPPFGPLTMNPELRKENCDYSVIGFVLASFKVM
jgi:hypothetical protein